MDEINFDQEPPNAFQTQLVELALHPMGLIRRRWIWMVLAFLVGVGGTAGLISTIVPEFRATSTVLVSSQQIPEYFVKSTVSGLDSLSNVNALVGEVLSQRHLVEMIEKYDLYPEGQAKGNIAGLVGLMRSKISIKPQRNVNNAQRGESSSIFVIAYDGETPQQAADVANSLASILIAASIEKRSEQARRTTEFLKRELLRAEEKLSEANREISEFNRRYRGELPGDLTTLLQKLDRMQQDRQTITEQITAAEDRLAQLETSETSSAAEQMLLELETQLNTELAIHTDEHPNVIALQRRIERLEQEIAGGRADGRDTRRSAVTIQIETTRRDLEKLRQRLAATDLNIKEYDARVDRIPRHAEEFAALEQRAAVLRETHTEFLRKLQDAELGQTLESAQQGPQVSLLDKAQPPGAPTKSKIFFLIPGIMMACALAGATGVALELVDPVILSPNHLEAVGTPPVLGSVYRLS